MKISKLFHWLYAFLMMLPIFAICSKILYVTINQNAKDSYYGDTINSENIVEDITNYRINNKYLFVGDSTLLSGTYDTYIDVLNIENVRGLSNDILTNIDNIVSFRYYYTGSIYGIQFKLNDNSTLYNWDTSAKFYFYVSHNFDTNIYTDFVSQIIYNDFTFIDNVFYYAVEQTRQEPLFTWVNTSAVYTPISYGSALFGVPSDSAINTYLAYWLNVSIIWLMFDVLVYVPLLAHRWLDKGIVE